MIKCINRLKEIIGQSVLGNDLTFSQELIANYNTGSSGDIKGNFNSSDVLNEFKRINKQIVDRLLTKEDSWLEEFPTKTNKFPKN